MLQSQRKKYLNTRKENSYVNVKEQIFIDVMKNKQKIMLKTF